MIEHLEHTADAKFKVTGNDLGEVFSESVIAMFQVITDSKVKPTIKKVVEIKADRLRTLLYEFLEAFLVFADTEGWVLSNIEIEHINNNSVKCIAYGSVDGYELNTQVKSITYSDMVVTKNSAIVVLDI